MVAYLPVMGGYVMQGNRIKYYPNSQPFWACNVCEYCK